MFKIRVLNVVMQMKTTKLIVLLALVGVLSACGGGGGGGGGDGGGFGADSADNALMTADLSGAARAQPATMGALEAN